MERIMRSLALILMMLSVVPSPSRAWEKRVDAHGKTIIAYYASWQWYDRNGLAKPANLDHSKVTRYNFAFFQINSSGDIWGTDGWADAITLYGEFDWNWVPDSGGYCSWAAEGEPPTCAGHFYQTGLISQAHDAGVEVYPSIGGWTLSDPFPVLAANEASRRKFAENCVALIETYDFDGIDIDWEYPGYAAHSGTPEDTVNYSLFLGDIREELDRLGERTGRFYGLTAALPCGPALIDNIQIDVVSDYLTELNLMTYDFHGSWNAETGANAPLYDMDGSPEFSVHGCVENWKAGGGRPEQINIGLPFYGRSFSGNGLTAFGQTHNGYADTVTWSDDEGSPQYFNIVDKLSQFTSVRDPQTKTQFLYNGQGFVSFDDERAICDKTEYAMDEGLNGYIIWEISGDLLRDLSTPLLDATNDRLNNPDVRCEPDMEDVEGMGGGMIEGRPWYPSQGLGYCVSDGKELKNFIAPSQMFGSALACCDAIFQHNVECLTESLHPGGNGQVISVDDSAQFISVDSSEDNLWYPSQKMGFCVNDRKHKENHIADDLLFSSAQDCCQAIYAFEPSCTLWSLNPGSDGTWIDSSEDSPWYPSQKMGFCVNNGKHKENHIADDLLFSSAQDCCKDVYSFELSCTLWSLNPGSDGTWIDYVDEGNPWYPQSKVGYCVADGKHGQNFIETSHLFNSAAACCDAVYSYNADCFSKSTSIADGGSTLGGVLWYPDGIGCSSEIPIPSWIVTTFGSNEECCVEYFGLFHDTCITGVIAQAVVTPITHAPTPYPTLRPTKESKQIPTNIDAYDQDAAVAPQPTPRPAKKPKPSPNNMDAYVQDPGTSPEQEITAQPTPRPTKKPKPNPNNMEAYEYIEDVATAATTPNQVAVEEQISLPAVPTVNENVQTEFLFYPNFGDGTSLDCRTGGNEPDWVSLDMMKNTKFQCCESVAPPWSDQCHNHPYYPNFQDHSCVNDGNQPDWMAGDYLADEQWLCCHNFFRESEMLGACAGIPECVDCDISVYLSSYYEVLNSQGRSN